VAARRRPIRVARGQHFLRSSRPAADLVREAGVQAGDLVVEIGAGPGILTRALACTGAEVIALELDPSLVTQLRNTTSARNVTVLEADAQRWPWPDTAFSVVANLPFAGSGAILARMLHDPRVELRHADVIVQWQFALKQAAVWPAARRSTYWRAWYDLLVVGRVARTAFSPAPGVDAAVLRITRRPRPLLPLEEHEAYRRFLDGTFRGNERLRRLPRARLSPLELKRLAPALGFAPDARPRDLDARQWAAVFAFTQGRR
jgi:23S rRNA (adenine-N6)-dimethyltransferase